MLKKWEINEIKLEKQQQSDQSRKVVHIGVLSNIEQVLATTPHETPTIRPLASHHENYPS